MRTNPTKKSARRCIAAVLAIFLASNAWADEHQGDETVAESPFPAMVAEIEAITEDLNALRATDHPEGGTTELIVRIELAERRHRFRARLEELANELAAAREQGAPEADTEEWLASLLEKDSSILASEVSEQNEIVVALLDALGEDDAVKRSVQTLLLVETAESDRLYSDFQKNLQLRGELGADVEVAQKELIARLRQRGRVQAGALRTIQIALDIAISRVGEADPTANDSQIARLNELEGSIAASTRVTIDLLDQLGQPANELREALITLTGSVVEDDLNPAVIRRLFEKWFDQVADWVRTAGPTLLVKLLFFAIIVFIARMLARVAERLVRTALNRSPVRTSRLLADFFVKSAGRVVLVLGVLIGVAQLGLQVGPLLAGLGIAGFVIGFALQDVLSNFASGMMILVYRPFDVGDFVEAGGVSGKVSDMTLVSTKILTFDNQLLFVPNNKIWGDVIRNVTHQDIRRVDLEFGIGYGDDIEQAETVLKSIIEEHEMILDDPESTVKLHTLGDSSVNFVVRPWVKTDDYWDVYWDITREVKRRFDAEGISIPFPQRDVHVYQEEHAPEKPKPEPGKSREPHTKLSQTTEESTLDHSDDE